MDIAIDTLTEEQQKYLSVWESGHLKREPRTHLQQCTERTGRGGPMTTTFMGAPSLVLTSESVTEGHPDKMCDQISDAILDDILRQDPMGRVACETAVTTGLVVVMGEITTQAYVRHPVARARHCAATSATRNAQYGFDYETCGVIVSIKEQSGDIAMGVDKALEARAGHAGRRTSTWARATRA